MEEQTYTTQAALAAATAYFEGNAAAARIWVEQYALRDAEGQLRECSPEAGLQRMARALARVEQRYAVGLTAEEIIPLLDHFRFFVPSGSLLASWADASGHRLLSGGAAIGPGGRADSYGAVMQVDEELLQLMKRNTGVGIDLSLWRPAGQSVAHSALNATGLVPFMKRFARSAQEVRQGERHTRLALTVDVRHPDAEAVLDIKMSDASLREAGLTLRIDAEFMRCVAEGTSYVQHFPTHTDKPQTSRPIDARTLWQKIIHLVWQTGHPNLLFLPPETGATSAELGAPISHLAATKAELAFSSTEAGQPGGISPIGKTPCYCYECVPHLALNLYGHVKRPFEPDAEVDFDLLEQHAALGVRLLDDMVDLELEKIDALIDEVEKAPEADDVKRTELQLWHKMRRHTAANRRIGLGVTALADMLAALGLKYGDPRARQVAQEVQRRVALAAYRASWQLGRERGPVSTSPTPDDAALSAFLHRLRQADAPLADKLLADGRRHRACLAVAPVEAAALVSQTSGGIGPTACPIGVERLKIQPGTPHARVDFVDEAGESYEERAVIHPPLALWMRLRGISIDLHYTPDARERLLAASPYAGSWEGSASPEAELTMQAALQQWADQTVCATLHVPIGAEESDVARLIHQAWQSGCHGCTLYRTGSRPTAPAAPRLHPGAAQQPYTEIAEIRPEKLECDVVRFQNRKEKWVAFVGLLDGRPYEIFTGLQDDEEGIVLPKTVTKGIIIKRAAPDGSKRYDFQFQNRRGYKTTVEGLSEKFNKEYWNYAKLISGVLRYRMPLDVVLKLVSSLQLGNESINTWKNGVERALKKYITDDAGGASEVCPHCGSDSLVRREGSCFCTHCGTSFSF